MSKRNRKRKPGSVRDRAEKKRKQHSIEETEDHALNKLRNKLDEKGSLSEQEWRTYEHLMQRKRKREVQKTGEVEETLPKGRLKEWVEKSYTMQKILKALDLPGGKKGIEKLFEQYHYSICSFCGYIHNTGEKCPFKIEAEKLGISLDNKVETSEEDIIEKEVERMISEEE